MHQVTSHIYRGCEFPVDRYYDVEREIRLVAFDLLLYHVEAAHE